ncbi:MAG: IS110 family transposase [Rhodospirillales bacterium]|nr:IS110 family transposase [Rhodospirillales bacterium]
MAFIGIDFHQNSFTLCCLDADGKDSFETWQLCRSDLDRFCATLDADDEFAIEATGYSAWFRDEVAPCVGRVVVVNPKQFQVFRKPVKKTDKNDARALALFLSKDMLPETRLKSKAEGELASLVHTRDLLVKQRTRLLNKIHALFNRHGVKLKKEGLASKRRLATLEIGRFSALEQVELKVVRDQAQSLSSAIAELDAEIERAAQGLEGYDSLVSIKGVGSRSAAVFLSGIGKIDDFESADKLAAYLGIVPRVSQSNQTDNRGRITKQGNKLMRTTLVQCTLIALRYSGYLNAYYRRIKERRGTGKAIIATSRKFLGIIYNALKNKWIFEDFSTYTLAESQISAGQAS